MKLKFLGAGLVLAIVLVGCGPKAEDGVTSSSSTPAKSAMTEATLRIKANKGDKFALAASMNMSADMSGVQVPPGPEGEKMKAQFAGEQSMNASATTNIEVLDVKDGKFTLKSTTTDVKTEAKGVFLMQQKTIEEDMKKEKTRTVNDRGIPDGAGDKQSEGMIEFPEKAVKVGDTWEGDSSLGMGGESKATFKLEAFETMGGKDVARISMTLPKDAKATVTKPFMFWIEVATGFPLKTEGAMTMEQGPGMKMTMEMNLNRK